MSSCSRPLSQGFTLIEILLVLVVIAVLTSITLMNSNSSDQRRVLQQREQFILDLQRLRLESVAQNRVLAIQFNPKRAKAFTGYQVLEYTVDNHLSSDFTQSQSASSTMRRQQPWQATSDFDERETLTGLDFLVTLNPSEITAELQNLLAQNKQNHLPQLIWFGNGESVSATIQVQYKNKPVGLPIQLNSLGLVEE